MASSVAGGGETPEPQASAAPPKKNADRSSGKKMSSVAEDDESIVRELCTVNGINYEKLQSGVGLTVKQLEIFFFGFPRVVGMQHFPNLTSLSVMNQSIDSMAGLQTCRHLEELWICEGNIARIECLQQCTSLVRLYLYTNRIARIAGLHTLTRLEKLWLNGNKIRKIEGLDTLSRLKDLNLAGNEIPAIGRSLEGHPDLEVLNLSGNRIASMKDLVHLSSLPKLHSLSLCEPYYRPSPVCQLCNYSTYTLYHLPQLQCLDGKDVSSPDLHKLVQGLVSKKKQFYRMKLHHTTQESMKKCEAVKNCLRTAQEATYCRMRALHHNLKTLQYEQEQAEVARRKSDALSQRVSDLEQHLENLECKCDEMCESVRLVMGEECERWRVELESGGNVKFVPGDPSLQWHNCCLDLVGSRFTVTDVQDLGINGLQVTKVLRVENRQLNNRFNEKLRRTLETEPYSSMTNQRSYKQLLDYLFLVWGPDFDVNSICQDGCGGGGGKVCVAMTNSVSVADHPRLRGRGGGGVVRGVTRFEHLSGIQRGQLVLCKVFVGQTAEHRGSSDPTHTAYPNTSCVYRQKLPSSSSSSSSSTLKSESHQREWFVFDRELVLPEYIINFEYTSQLLPADPLSHVMSHDPLVVGGPQQFCSDEELISLEPALPVRPRLAMLDEATALRLSGSTSLSEMRSLILHDNRLTRFRLAPSVPLLTRLVLCFNELTSAEDIQRMPNLEFLDLSFNHLSSLDGLRTLPKLSHLDISWNLLTSYHDDLTILRKHAPALESLDARHNPWTKPGFFRGCALGRMKSLRKLDGSAVSQDEASSALRQVVVSHLSLTTLLGHSHTDTQAPQSLTLAPIAETVHRESRNRPLQLSNSSNDWCSKVSSVRVCGLGLRKLSCLDHLPNLRWLSLEDNLLTSIEGLSLCTKLEELTVDRNLLQCLDPVRHFPNLKWLSASDNHLSSLPPGGVMTVLGKMEYLNVSRNRLGSLEGLQHLASLEELYASGNSISNLRELFHIKPLSHLTVLDLSDNPIAQPAGGGGAGRSRGYRMFTLYHVSLVKALDGKPIDTGELANARERLGGLLTEDMIYERHRGVDPSSLQQMDLPNCGLKHVDLNPVQHFNNLASLNLEHNSLTSFSGLIYLDNLKVLCLNHNRVECLVTSRDPQPPSSVVMESLQVLHLAYNGIGSLAPLQLGRIPSLRALFLQGNEVSRVEGLGGLENLTELVLDRNKIKALQEDSLTSLHHLRELHIEENRLRDLSHFSSLVHLERLYLGMNRIQDYAELEKLGCHCQLLELSVISNPVSRRMQHRSLLIFKLSSLLSLDGVIVTAEERQIAVSSYSEAQEEDIPELAPPGLANSTPLKVMNVPVPFAHIHPHPPQAGHPVGVMTHSQRRRQLLEARAAHLQSLQSYHEKRRGRR